MNNTELFTLDNVIHFGLDQLNIFGTFKFEEKMFEKIGFTNQKIKNMKKEEEKREKEKKEGIEIEEYKKIEYEGKLAGYTFIKIELYRYQYKIIFKKDGYTLFDYYKAEKETKSAVKSRNQIVVHGKAFKYLNYDLIQNFIETNFNLEKCIRVDICIDFKIYIEKVINEFKELKTGANIIKNWDTETRYIGEVKKNVNKRSLIRIYNKVRSILKNNEQKLYSDYMLEDNVTRVELELRPELAKNISPYELFDDDNLLRIFKNYLKKHTSIFDIYDVIPKTLYKKPNKKITAEMYQSTAYRDKRINVFLGHARGIFENGYCPTRILIGAGLIQENTKKFLDNDIVEILGGIEGNLRSKELNKIKKRRHDEKTFKNNKKDKLIKIANELFSNEENND